MKPILFAKDETNFTTNGLGRLDCISCHVIEERNGMYELEAEIPVTGNHASEVEMLSIIGVIPSDGESIQAFVVYKITKPLNGRFQVYARHISYRLSDIPAMPFSVEKSAQACNNTLQGLKNNAAEPCPFTFTTDVNTSNSYTQKTPASIRQRLGGIEGSVIDQFGGEYKWDNFNVSLLKSRGRLATTTGITLRYGKNIIDINQEEEIANTITGVVPFWIDSEGENLVVLPNKEVVYSENHENYPYNLTVALDMSSNFQNQPTVSQLRAAATTYVQTSGIGIPKVSIKVSFINLWETEEYKDIAPLERVKLCDEVYVYFEKLGINAIAKVVKTDYDVLKGRYISIEVGSLRATLAQAVTDRDKNVKEEFVHQMEKMNNVVSSATAWLTNSNGYVFARKNDDGTWKELFFMSSPDPYTAQNGIRINENGIGFFSKAVHPQGNIIDGPYDVAWTIDGRLGDFANKNFWNFLTGEFALSADTTVGGSTVQAIANAAAAAAKAYADTIVNTSQEYLQDQIDGNITSYFENYEPTMSNYPVSEWAQASEPVTEFKKHMGDLFYDSDTGYCYRFQVKTTAPVDPGQWAVTDFEWVQISDEDIAKAMDLAQTAQDTADGKRRVFVNNPNDSDPTKRLPKPPYDVGDMWVQGSNGDILRCSIEREENDPNYSVLDWILASKYTDDTYIQTWITNTYGPQTEELQNQIDKRAETWYQATDPSLEWGGCTIKLDPQCKTEETYDYIDIYYKVINNGVTTYSYIRRSGEFGGQSINIPSREFWVYWHSDQSIHNYYGWRVESVEVYTGNDYTTPRETGKTALPGFTPIDTDIDHLESEHNPYSDGVDILYHSKLSLLTHKGDLWYRTTDDTTWYYDGVAWVQQNVPTAVFDKIDGKAQIFTNTIPDHPEPPYNEGDLWCQGSTGDILTCTASRSAGEDYHAADWSKKNKYTDDTAVGSLDESLDMDGIMNRLTHGLKSEGIYLEGGHIYLNVSMAKIGKLLFDIMEGGMLTLGGNNNGSGILVAMGTPSAKYNSSLSAGDHIGYSWEPITRVKTWIHVSGTGSDPVGQYRLGSGSWIDLYPGDTNFGVDKTDISLQATSSFSYTIYEAEAVTVIDEYGIKTSNIQATGTGLIGDLHLEYGELYALGELPLAEKSASTGANKDKYLYSYFTPSKLYIAGTFHISVDFEVDVSAYRVVCRLEKKEGSYYNTKETQTFMSPQEDQVYTCDFDLEMSAYDTSSWRVYIFLDPGGYRTNIKYSVYTKNVKIVSISENGCYGQFNGTHRGSGIFDGLSADTFDVNDIDVKDLKITDEGISRESTTDNYKIHLLSDLLELVRSSTKYTKIAFDSRPQILVKNSDSYYIDIDAYNPPSIDIEADSSNFVTLKTNNLEGKISGSRYYVTWSQGSDRRLKENIKELDIDLSRNLINATKPQEFNYKNVEGKHYGMIAQDVRELLDSLGEKDAVLERSMGFENEPDEGMQNLRTLDYIEYLPHLINYVKSLNAEIEALKIELNSLKRA